MRSRGAVGGPMLWDPLPNNSLQWEKGALGQSLLPLHEPGTGRDPGGSPQTTLAEGPSPPFQQPLVPVSQPEHLNYRGRWPAAPARDTLERWCLEQGGHPEVPAQMGAASPKTSAHPSFAAAKPPPRLAPVPDNVTETGTSSHRGQGKGPAWGHIPSTAPKGCWGFGGFGVARTEGTLPCPSPLKRAAECSQTQESD